MPFHFKCGSSFFFFVTFFLAPPPPPAPAEDPAAMFSSLLLFLLLFPVSLRALRLSLRIDDIDLGIRRPDPLPRAALATADVALGWGVFSIAMLSAAV